MSFDWLRLSCAALGGARGVFVSVYLCSARASDDDDDNDDVLVFVFAARLIEKNANKYRGGHK